LKNGITRLSTDHEDGNGGSAQVVFSRNLGVVSPGKVGLETQSPPFFSKESYRIMCDGGLSLLSFYCDYIDYYRGCIRIIIFSSLLFVTYLMGVAFFVYFSLLFVLAMSSTIPCLGD